MKTRYIPLILAILLLGSCQERDQFAGFDVSIP